MTTDSGKKLSSGKAHATALPSIVSIHWREARYEAPRRRHLTSARAEHDGKTVLEFIVHTDASLPVRALAPCLYIGAEKAVECVELEPNVYRFIAFDPDGLEAEQSIDLGWLGAPDEPRRSAERTFTRTPKTAG